MANYRLPEVNILTRKEINKLPRPQRMKYRADCLKAARFWLIKSDQIHLYRCIDKVEEYMESDYKWSKILKDNKMKKL